MNDKPNIIEAFIKASKEFKKPKFNQVVKYGATNFKYADLNEIYDCVKEPLLKQGLVIMHDIFEEDGLHYINTYIQHFYICL